MIVNEIEYDGPPPIDAYGGGGFRVGGERREGSLSLTPSGAASWNVGVREEISAESVAGFLACADEIDVLLIGVGAELGHLPAEAREALEAAGVGFEAMTTASACRTYNVLLAEGRRVAAALIAV